MSNELLPTRTAKRKEFYKIKKVKKKKKKDIKSVLKRNLLKYNFLI